jgi:phosphoglycolate phosphatase
VGVSWGFRTVGELQKAGADHIINRPEELLYLL